MKKGDMVSIFPHGNEEQRWPAHIEICSRNERSLAVTFEHVPPFLNTRDGVSIYLPTERIIMLLTREAIDGVPWGPWIEVMGGGHYEIEERAPGTAQ